MTTTRLRFLSTNLQAKYVVVYTSTKLNRVCLQQNGSPNSHSTPASQRRLMANAIHALVIRPIVNLFRRKGRGSGRGIANSDFGCFRNRRFAEKMNAMQVGAIMTSIGQYIPPMTGARMAIPMRFPNRDEPVSRNRGRDIINVLFGSSHTCAIGPALRWGRAIANMMPGISKIAQPIHKKVTSAENSIG